MKHILISIGILLLIALFTTVTSVNIYAGNWANVSSCGMATLTWCFLFALYLNRRRG